MTHHHPYVVFAGAAPDTGNHGVTALSHATIIGLQARGVTSFTQFDHGRAICPAGDDRRVGQAAVSGLAFRAGRRLYDPANMHQARLRQLVGFPSAAVQAIVAADAVIDISGGDSFTDLYGRARFDQIVLPKRMVLDAGTPLILLPQTYGPFSSDRARKTARRILDRATLAFARDAASLDVIRDLLGDDFSPARHRLGVDMAFGLPATAGLALDRPRWVGLNISGLLWNDPAAASARFGLTADYQSAILRILDYILRQSPCQILLVPHVTPTTPRECDLVAAHAARDRLPARLRRYVHIETRAKTPADLKAVISGLDWFAGARMHATIAALSRRVPVANMAYSVKAAGVFDLCGVSDQVFDMRQLSTDDLVRGLVRSFDDRASLRPRLQKGLPAVEQSWRNQMDLIAGTVKTLADMRGHAHAS